MDRRGSHRTETPLRADAVDTTLPAPRSTSLRRRSIACTIVVICKSFWSPLTLKTSWFDAVLSASRVLVAVSGTTLADVGEEVTLTQYRSLVVLASRGPQGVAALADAVSVTPHRLENVRPPGQKGPRDTSNRPARPAPGPHCPVPGGPAPGRRGDGSAPRRDRATRRHHPQRSRGGVVDTLRHLGETAGEVPEQDWSTGWDL